MPSPSTSTAGKKVVQYEPPIPGLAEQREPGGGDQRADDQRQPGAVALRPVRRTSATAGTSAG